MLHAGTSNCSNNETDDSLPPGARLEIVELLLAAGVDVNKADNDGVTPLAAMLKSMETASCATLYFETSGSHKTHNSCIIPPPPRINETTA